MKNIYAALEIGTTRTVMAIAESDAAGRLKISSMAEILSSGVRKSQILSISDATQSIRSVLHELEDVQSKAGAKISIGNVFLVVSGQHVQTIPFQGVTQIGEGCVKQEDVNAVVQSAHAVALPRDRELLDIIDQDYVLDRRGNVPNPLGMSGKILSLNTLQIHADRNRIQDARKAAEASHLEIREPLFAVTCAADAVLEEHEKKNGVLVLDFGGGSTGYAVYSDGYVASAGVIGVGGDHITNDIAHAFQTTNAQAESVKIREASATIVSAPELSARVRVEAGDNALMDNRTISRRALDTVVNARVLELLTVLRETLEDQDLLHRLHSGVVITGGGAQLKNLDALIQQTLGSSVRIGRPIHVDGFDDRPFPPSYAAIAGALLYGYRNYEEKSMLDSILGRFFK